jgi:hypothetical protein
LNDAMIARTELQLQQLGRAARRAAFARGALQNAEPGLLVN